MNRLLLFYALFSLIPFNILPQGKVENSQPGGLFLPSEGEITVMIVFVQFPDDNFIPPNNDQWPRGGNPSNMDKWLDEEWTGQPTPGSMTDYFNQMSLGKLKVTGKAVSLTALNTREWYANEKWTRYNIHRQIIEKQLDPEWDFTQFDNWTINKRYSCTLKPDGKIDYIFFIWRNVDMDLTPDVISAMMKKMDMGWIGSIGSKPSSEPDFKIHVDNGARYFDVNTYGSGCTVINYFFKDAFRFAIHEFAHNLLGGNNFHSGHAFWAMLSGYEVRSFMINAWERHRLGWGNVITIPKKTGTIKNAELKDFITTGDAYRIEIDSASNQYFFIEYHQGISEWDKCSGYPEDKGIFVFRQDAFGTSAFGGTADWLKLIPAEGRYKWNITRWEQNQWGPGNLPVFQKAGPDSDSGYSPTDFQMLSKPGDKPNIKANYEIIYQEGGNGNIINEPLRSGKGKDAFRPGFNEVFSPWSNPNSQDKNKKETGIGFKIKSIENGKAVLDIYINTAEKTLK